VLHKEKGEQAIKFVPENNYSGVKCEKLTSEQFNIGVICHCKMLGFSSKKVFLSIMSGKMEF